MNEWKILTEDQGLMLSALDLEYHLFHISVQENSQKK